MRSVERYSNIMEQVKLPARRIALSLCFQASRRTSTAIHLRKTPGRFVCITPCLRKLFMQEPSVCQTATMTVTSELDTTDPKSSSLRTTILAANTVGGDNTIILTNNIYKLTISGRNEDAASSGDLDITRGNLTIIGLSLSNVIVTAAGLGDRVFQVLPGAQLTLSNLCITGGTGSDGTNADFSVGGNGESGGGIYNAGTL